LNPEAGDDNDAAAMPWHRVLLSLMVGSCIVLETAEQSFYRLAGRAGGNRGRYVGSVVPAVVTHVVRLLIWYLVLRQVELAVAVPLMGATYITIALVGRVFFHERVDRRRWLGTALIAAGFVLVACHVE
jgi:drug/metabolite transporter (DMT)-like permease